MGAPDITTHVLDTVTGEPGRGIRVRLERLERGDGSTVGEGRTDGDGRLGFAIEGDVAGVYRMIFDVEPYLGDDGFYPEVTVTFRVRDPRRHHHVPLLLSRYGYTTYRGS